MSKLDTGVKPRFCRGSKCRSAWHAEHKRQALAAILQHIDQALVDLRSGPLARPLSARVELQAARALLAPMVRP